MVALLGQKVIFTIGDYLGLYNEAFGTSRKASEPPKHPDRLIIRLEAFDGKFDHWRSAEILLCSPAKVEKLSPSTLSNFENLHSPARASSMGAPGVRA